MASLHNSENFEVEVARVVNLGKIDGGVWEQRDDGRSRAVARGRFSSPKSRGSPDCDITARA